MQSHAWLAVFDSLLGKKTPSLDADVQKQPEVTVAVPTPTERTPTPLHDVPTATAIPAPIQQPLTQPVVIDLSAFQTQAQTPLIKPKKMSPVERLGFEFCQSLATSTKKRLSEFYFIDPVEDEEEEEESAEEEEEAGEEAKLPEVRGRLMVGGPSRNPREQVGMPGNNLLGEYEIGQDPGTGRPSVVLSNVHFPGGDWTIDPSLVNLTDEQLLNYFRDNKHFTPLMRDAINMAYDLVHQSPDPVSRTISLRKLMSKNPYKMQFSLLAAGCASAFEVVAFNSHRQRVTVEALTLSNRRVINFLCNLSRFRIQE